MTVSLKMFANLKLAVRVPPLSYTKGIMEDYAVHRIQNSFRANRQNKIEHYVKEKITCSICHEIASRLHVETDIRCVGCVYTFAV